MARIQRTGIGPVPSNGDAGSKRRLRRIGAGGVIALVMMGISGAWVIGCAAGIAVAVTVPRWKIGGITGDTLGATQMLGETFTLLAAFNF